MPIEKSREELVRGGLGGGVSGSPDFLFVPLEPQ
jgi:hypothetical protein